MVKWRDFIIWVYFKSMVFHFEGLGKCAWLVVNLGKDRTRWAFLHNSTIYHFVFRLPSPSPTPTLKHKVTLISLKHSLCVSCGWHHRSNGSSCFLAYKLLFRQSFSIKLWYCQYVHFKMSSRDNMHISNSQTLGMNLAR